MESWDGILSALAGVPVLRGAHCRGHTVHDPQNEGEPAEVAEARWAQAMWMCQGCPALDDCGAWFDSLEPKMRPQGVVAGRLYIKPNRRREAS